MSHQNPIIQVFSKWMQRNFQEPGAVSLFFSVLFGLLFIQFFGGFFLPVLVSVVLAYLFHGVVSHLAHWKVPRPIAVFLVYSVFLMLFVCVLLFFLPYLIKQLSNLIQELPHAFTTSQAWVAELLKRYPGYLSHQVLQHLSDFFKDHTSHIANVVFQASLTTLSSIVQIVIYFVMVPLLVFFFLSDAGKILRWFSQFMPKERSLVLQVWSDFNNKMGAYIRGRALEMLITGSTSVIVFSVFGLQYSVLLGILVGLSVLIPYVGAILVTVPVVIIALMQWGLTTTFLYLLGAYAVIIILDGYVLAPFLFSEAMDLHPIVIILSVVVFGGIWGFWGIFFAIPLATLFHAVLDAWPKPSH